MTTNNNNSRNNDDHASAHAPWCFDVDCRTQNIETNITSSQAYKHCRLFVDLKSASQNHPQGVDSSDRDTIEQRMKRIANTMNTVNDFTVRFGDLKHFRDVKFSCISKVFGKHIKDGKLSIQMKPAANATTNEKFGDVLLLKGQPNECSRLMKIIITMKQAPAEDRKMLLSQYGKCKCCELKIDMKEKKEKEREDKRVEKEHLKEEEKTKKIEEKDKKEEEKKEEKQKLIVLKSNEELNDLESVRREIAKKTCAYEKEREELKLAKKAVKALTEQIEDEKRMYSKEKKDLATEKEAMEEERKAMNVERARLNAKIEENKELKQRVERERETYYAILNEKTKEIEHLR